MDLDISKLELHKVFAFSQNPPFLVFDADKLNTLQSLFKLNPMEGQLGKMKDSIITFIKSLEEVKKVYAEYSKELREIKDECWEFISHLNVKDGLSEVYKQCMIGKNNLKKILNMKDILDMFGTIGSQIKETVEVFGKAATDPNNFKDYDNLAKKLISEKQTEDMMKVVWFSTNEPKLDNFNDWKNNFEYRIVGEIQT